MQKSKRKTADPIPKNFADEKKAAEFWDTHSVADYWDEMQDAHFEIELDDTPKAVALEYPLARQLSEVSRLQNLSVDTLVNFFKGTLGANTSALGST
ncbi:hypothetical protein HUU05_09790 [candidate division KSB1 bacterium]|nr:hypothetical protein [candidate division KSB1 bacterium]